MIIVTKNNWKYNLCTALKLKADNEEMQLLKMKIADEVAQYHIGNKVSGKVLCKSCHKKEHEKYNF